MTGAEAADAAAPGALPATSVETPAAVASRGRLPRYRGLAFRRSLKWLLWGVAAYAVALMVAIAADPSAALLPIFGPSLYLTPLFGLPCVIATIHRPGRVRRLIYFMLLVPLAHVAANYVAWSHAMVNFDPGAGAVYADNLKSGALGGVTGATLAFTFLFLARLIPRPRAELATMGLATLALTAIGALGVANGLAWALALDDAARAAAIIWFECVHLPWQAAFAAALAWLMRTAPLGKSRTSLPRESG